MGCEQSKLANLSPISISIVDSSFLKPSGSPTAALLQRHHIQCKVFMSIDCLLDSLAETYTNNIVVREAELPRLQLELAKAKLDPRVFVLGRRDARTQGKRVVFFENYEELPGLLEQREKIQQVSMAEERTVEVRILKDFKGEAESQLFIFQQTLKTKGISYQIYGSFGELESSRITGALLVVDYRFHRAAIALSPNSKVICYCDLSPQQNYDPQVFFITSNFQEIVNEILIFKRLSHPVLPISKTFFCSTSPAFLRYAPIFEAFSLKVRAYGTIAELIKTTRLYFSVMVVCPEEEAAEVERQIREDGCGFRMRVLSVPVGTECSAVGLRRVLREVKRGYLVERGPSRAVDIIDKYHSSAKFQQIKRELTANGITFKCYPSIMSYCKSLTFIAPVIICNFDDRFLLHHFLGEVQIRAKVVIFCNRSKITEQLTRDPRWSFVSSHFGKIIRHIRTHHVLLPLVLDQLPQKTRQQQVEGKNREHRLSAAKWAEQNAHTNTNASIHEQFIIDGDSGVAGECAQLFKLSSHPIDSFQRFRKDLLASLAVLRSQYKLSILDSDFTTLSNEFSQATLEELFVRARRFLGEEKEMGIGINNTLKSAEGSIQQARATREAVFLLCLNFLSCYQLPASQNCRLSCWTQEANLKLCEVGSVLLCRNFLVMREEGTVEELPGCVRLQLDLQYSPLKALRPEVSPYFVFDGRYVFAPYSQLKVRQVDAENDQRVVHLTLLPQNQFLQHYFEQNIGKDLTNIFRNELAKPSTPLVSVEHKHHLQSNLSRLQAYSLSAQGSDHLGKAISMQRELIRLEEQRENFDSRLLTELKFQLATFLSLANGSEELMELIAEIRDGSPSGYVKRECAGMLAKLRAVLEDGREERARTNKCIELKEQIERESDEQEQEEVVEHGGQFQNIFHCLELEEREGLTEQFT